MISRGPNGRTRTPLVFAWSAVVLGACSFPTIEYGPSDTTGAGGEMGPACEAPEECATTAKTCGAQSKEREQTCHSNECETWYQEDMATCNVSCQSCCATAATPCTNAAASCAALIGN